MRVYKKKYISYSYTPGKEWLHKKEDGSFEEYIGPIVNYVNKSFGGSKLTRKLELTMKLYPFQESRTALLYDELKPEYARQFIEPTGYKHKLTEEELEKGKFSRYFIKLLTTYEIVEIDKKQFEYYQRNSTPYHKNAVSVEIKQRTSPFAYDINKGEISLARETIKDIDEHIHPADFVIGEIPNAPSTGEYYRPKIKLPE